MEEKKEKKEKGVKPPNQKPTDKGKKDDFEENDLDFGGLPKNVPFKKNIGCGG